MAAPVWGDGCWRVTHGPRRGAGGAVYVRWGGGQLFFAATAACSTYLVRFDSLVAELRSTCHSSKINDVVFPVTPRPVPHTPGPHVCPPPPQPTRLSPPLSRFRRAGRGPAAIRQFVWKGAGYSPRRCRFSLPRGAPSSVAPVLARVWHTRVAAVGNRNIQSLLVCRGHTHSAYGNRNIQSVLAARVPAAHECRPRGLGPLLAGRAAPACRPSRGGAARESRGRRAARSSRRRLLRH